MPARVHKHLTGLPELPGKQPVPVSWAMHFGQAALLGVLHSVMAHAGLHEPLASTKFTVVRLTTDQILEHPPESAHRLHPPFRSIGPHPFSQMGVHPGRPRFTPRVGSATPPRLRDPVTELSTCTSRPAPTALRAPTGREYP